MLAKSPKYAQLKNVGLSLRINRTRFFGDGDDSIDDATNIGKLSKSFKYDDDGSVSRNDPDFYKFKVKGTGSLKLNFRNQGDEPITFSIVNKRDRVISVDGRRLFQEVDEDEKSKLSARLSKGTYYLKIDTDGSREGFSFKLKFKSNRSDDDNDDD